MKQLNKVLDECIDTIRSDINSDKDTLKGRMNSTAEAVWQDQTDSHSANSRALNLVIRKLPESVNENIAEEVKQLESRKC